MVTADESGQLESFVDDVHFRAARTGESWSRLPNGTGRLAPSDRTLGAGNSFARVGPIFISQVHYHPAAPSVEALNEWPQLTTRELEFIEVHNPLDVDVDLTDWRLRGGIDFDFPAGARIDPGTSVLLVSFDPQDAANSPLVSAFLTEYELSPQRANLIGPYAGQLDNDGELLVLLRPDAPPMDDPNFVPRTVADEVVYDDRSPWPTDADGRGLALHRGQVPGVGNLPSSWVEAPPLFMSSVPGDLNNNGSIDPGDIDQFCQALRQGDPRFDLDRDGTIGRTDLITFVEQVLGTVVGDANLDGTFDSGDLVEVFRAGQYEDDQAGNSTWASGDWDCDREFSTSDLVLAFQRGGYVAAAEQRSALPAVGAALQNTKDRQSDGPTSAADDHEISMPLRREVMLEATLVDSVFERNAARDERYESDGQVDDNDWDFLP